MKFRILLLELLLLGCTPASPPKSTPMVMTDVKIDQSEARPKLVQIERKGDPWPALAVAFLHGLDAFSGDVWARELRHRLDAAGLHANVRSFATGLVLSVSLKASSSSVNPVKALRDAMQAAALTAVPSSMVVDYCGMSAQHDEDESVAPGYGNVVLAVVGDQQAIERVTNWYDSAGRWVQGKQPSITWPAADYARSEPLSGPAEVVVAKRTPLRARSAQAAYSIGRSDSTLGLLAHSFPGKWRLLEAQSNYLPGGACLAVRLQSDEATNPTQAARVANTVATELDWVLNEQTEDEDPRVVALEAFTAQDAAERAAWLSAVELLPLGKDSSTFATYRGPDGETNQFEAGLAEKPALPSLPLISKDQPGQGQVWASLVSSCAVQHEDESTAGHVWSALTAATRGGTERHSVRASTTRGQVSLLASQSSRIAGAEDAVAEQLARSLLLFHRDSSGISGVRSELAASLPKVATWNFALKIATSGHPSWLTAFPTDESLLALSPDSARQALEFFAGSPLELDVLTTQGDAQGHRLAARLGHLLSGLREHTFSCLAPSSRAQRMPTSGEYGVEAPVGTPAVLIYVLDGRFSGAVRRVATALGLPGGWLERSLPASTFQVHVSASGLGSNTTLSALAFSIAAETDEQLSNTVAQVRELVRRLTVANLGLATPREDGEDLTPQDRLDRLFRAASDETAQLDELLSRALATAPLVYVQPIQSN